MQLQNDSPQEHDEDEMQEDYGEGEDDIEVADQ